MKQIKKKHARAEWKEGLKTRRACKRNMTNKMNFINITWQ